MHISQTEMCILMFQNSKNIMFFQIKTQKIWSLVLAKACQMTRERKIHKTLHFGSQKANLKIMLSNGKVHGERAIRVGTLNVRELVINILANILICIAAALIINFHTTQTKLLNLKVSWDINGALIGFMFSISILQTEK